MESPAWAVPTIADFCNTFYRDFPFAPSDLANDKSDDTLRRFVINPDIQNAINLANADFNPGLFGTNATLIFMYLAAHYLVLEIRNSSMGLNSQAKFPLMSTSVGGVTTTNKIDDIFGKDPCLSKYLKTGAGQIYLDMVYPYTIGAGLQLIPGNITNA